MKTIVTSAIFAVALLASGSALACKSGCGCCGHHMKHHTHHTSSGAANGGR